MIRRFVMPLLLLLGGCSEQKSVDSEDAELNPVLKKGVHHTQVDFEHWSTIFPIETFQRTSGIRQYDSTEKGDPLDLWKASGEIITSPAHLCNIELVRKKYAKTRKLGRAVPVDIFLWSVEPSEKPYLTRLGGVPYRDASKPWPMNDKKKPCTFVAQFCFLDSKDIVSKKIPGDVMLIFFKGADSMYKDGVHVEWVNIGLKNPIKAGDCPTPSFVVPQLYGHIYRTNAYPDSWDVFEEAGHDQCYLFPTTQSTKIGRETFYIQNDGRKSGDELICVLNSVHPSKGKWPFIGLEELPEDWDMPKSDYEWGKYRMMFADVGCFYFQIDKNGKVSWSVDSY